jgi:hypothetical protein
MEQGLSGRPGGLSSASPTAPVVAAVPVSTPDAERSAANCSFYPACYIMGDCDFEEWRRSKCGLPKAEQTQLRAEWLANLRRDGARHDLIKQYAREVHAGQWDHLITQGIEAGTATTGTGVVHESPVGGNADAPTPTLVNQGEAEILREAAFNVAVTAGALVASTDGMDELRDSRKAVLAAMKVVQGALGLTIEAQRKSPISAVNSDV